MIPRLGDGNLAVCAAAFVADVVGLENDSPSRGRKPFETGEFLVGILGLENDSPSKGRKRK